MRGTSPHPRPRGPTRRLRKHCGYRVPSTQSPRLCGRENRRAYRLDDVICRDAEAIEQFFGLAAAGNLADGQTTDGQPRVGNRIGDRVADAAGFVVILDSDQTAAGGAACGDQASAIDWRYRVQV